MMFIFRRNIVVVIGNGVRLDNGRDPIIRQVRKKSQKAGDCANEILPP